MYSSAQILGRSWCKERGSGSGDNSGGVVYSIYINAENMNAWRSVSSSIVTVLVVGGKFERDMYICGFD